MAASSARKATGRELRPAGLHRAQHRTPGAGGGSGIRRRQRETALGIPRLPGPTRQARTRVAGVLPATARPRPPRRSATRAVHRMAGGGSSRARNRRRVTQALDPAATGRCRSRLPSCANAQRLRTAAAAGTLRQAASSRRRAAEAVDMVRTTAVVAAVAVVAEAAVATPVAAAIAHTARIEFLPLGPADVGRSAGPFF